MKKGFFKRFVSAFMAGVLMITSNSVPISSLANTSKSGVGIYNNIMTDQSIAQAEYVVKFYKLNGTEVMLPTEIDFDTATLTPVSNTHAVISLNKDQKYVSFSDNPAFQNFVRENAISKIAITYQTEKINLKNTSLLYSPATQIYDFSDTSDTGELRSKLDYTKENPFEGYSDTLKTYDSTLMKEVPIEQDWRDRGADRPEIEDIIFDVKQNNKAYISGMGTQVEHDSNLYIYNITSDSLPYEVYRELEVKDSNTYLYHYTVPEKDKNGQDYTYSSTQTYTFESDKYKVESTNTNDKYLAVGLRDFKFTMKWADAYDSSARPTIDVDYIKNNFELYNKNTNTKITFPDTLPENDSWDNYIQITQQSDNTVNVTIKRLEDINVGGTANEYYLVLSSGQQKLAVNTNAIHASQDDYYAVKSENQGLHVNETDKTYENGVIDLLLTGTTNFNGHVEWKDEAKASKRENDDLPAATFNLWRYSGNDSDYSAKVGSPVLLDGKTYDFSFNNLDKYDIKGQKYTYYAIESVSVDETITENEETKTIPLPYQISYDNTDSGLDTGKLFDKGKAINKLSDKLQYTVSGEWIAAARQGGIADATYQLQIYDKTQNKYVPYTYEVIIDNQTETRTADVTLHFDELHMSRATDDEIKFPVVDLYDENGSLNQYRVVQTSVTRIDQISDEDRESTDKTEIGGDKNPKGAEISVNDKYAVAMTQNGTNYHFKYMIEGDTIVNIKKKWVYKVKDANGKETETEIEIPVSELQNGYQAQFDVQNYSNDIHGYRDYFVENDYPEGYFDSYLKSQYFIRKTKIVDNWYTDEQIAQGNLTVPENAEKYIYFNEEATKLSSSTWEVNNISVPKYDDDGREIDYRAVEMREGLNYPKTDDDGEIVSYYQTYDWNVTYTGTGDLITNYNYEITNHRTYPGNDHHYIAVNKEWVDDGELEYRQPIQIIANNVGTYIDQTDADPANWHVVEDGEKKVTLNKLNVWENTINVSQYKKGADGQYIKDENGHFTLLDYNYEADKFSEEPVNPDQNKTYYWSKNNILSIGSLPEGERWIYKLLTDDNGNKKTDYRWNNEPEDITLTPNDYNSVNLMENNFINFENFVGIYKSKELENNAKRCHYYAVQQVYTPSGVNGAVGTLHFINTRIGVISYEVQFDWNVGDALTNGNIKSVTIAIKNPVTDQVISQTVNFTNLEHLTQLSNGNYAFYFLNLPKYDTNGKLIDYQIQEVNITDNYNVEHPVDSVKNEATIGTDKCKVTISSETIIEGSEAKTDDLHRIVITNTFEDDTSITVHKRWYDNTNAENTRSDLYIKLYRISEDPDATEESDPKEYGWTKHDNDTDNRWTYTFDHLSKYDSNGYKYTYYVKEQDAQWLLEYDTNHKAKITENPSNRLPGYMQEYSNPNVATNPKVYTTTYLTNVAYNEGTIINRLHGEVIIDGEKLWKNISSVLLEQDYPIADVSLFRDNNVIEIEKKFETTYESDPTLADLDNALRKEGVTEDEIKTLITRQQKIDKLVEIQLSKMSDQEIAANIIKLSETQVTSGAKTFNFTDVYDEDNNVSTVSLAISKGYVVLDQNGNVKKDAKQNIILPKYDEAGRRITYTMTEKPINGYLSKIEPGSQKLINEYNGGRKLQFTVTKDWKGMTDNMAFPTITFTLHQVFKVQTNDAEQPYHYYVYNQFKREIRATGASNVTVTFGDADHPAEADALRYYSPVGEPFVYFITETLSNYEGEQAIFIDPQYEKYITEYLKPFNENPKYQEIRLVNNTGLALGFTCQVTDPLDDTDDLARAAAIASLKAAYTGTEPYTPTDQEIAIQMEKELKDEKTTDALNHTETFQNTYKPDDTNFHGKINITKEWQARPTEHSQVRAYSFKLTRKTKQIPSEELFTINTIDSYSTSGSLPTISDLKSGYTATAFQASTVDTEVKPPTETEIIKYYIATVSKETDAGDNPITVIISVANKEGTAVDYNNEVMIRNLAVYGQDALKYTYSIEELEKEGYTATKKTDKTDKNGLSTDSSADPAELSLTNKLKVFDLKINKSFGCEYTDGTTDKISSIPSKDYAQFFNDAYFNQLEFHIYRQVINGEREEIGYDGNLIDEQNPKLLTGKIILDEIKDNLDKTDAAKDLNYGETTTETFAERYAIISDLPLTDVNGNYYTYWVEEVDKAQLTSDGIPIASKDKHVSTYYSKDRIFEYPRDKNAQVIGISEDNKVTKITLEKADNGKTKETHIQNVFEAKLINIKKYWLDNNNEDGLRPELLQVIIKEKVNSTEEVTFTRILRNESDWSMSNALAKYYFNGTNAIEKLEYNINETESNTETESDTDKNLLTKLDNSSNTLIFDGYTLVDQPDNASGKQYYFVTEATTYKTGEKNRNGTDRTYTVGTGDECDAPVSDTDYQKLKDIDTWNLTNYKIPQKGKLTLTKKFDPVDEDYKSSTRPKHLYFQLKENDTLFTKYTELGVKVTDGTVDPSSGLITVNRIEEGANQYNYPIVTVSNLPIGSNETATPQKNGSFIANQYQFVECDERGNILTKTGNQPDENDHFPYTWDGGKLNSAQEGKYPDKDKTVELEEKIEEQTITYQNDYEINNTLKQENHIVKKKWKDDANNNIPNYYQTRPDYFIVRLEKTVDENPAPTGNWTVVRDKIRLKADSSSLDYHDQLMDTDDEINIDYLKNLPQYDGEGKKIYYRVVETALIYMVDDPNNQGQKIEETRQVKKDNYTQHSSDNSSDKKYDATNTYYVSYNDNNIDNDLTDQQTLIENTLIRKTDWQNFVALKKWDDNDNQFENRTPIKVKLIQSIMVNGEKKIIKEKIETLEESNNWYYKWQNYPLRDEAGHEFNYEIVEISNNSENYDSVSNRTTGGTENTEDSYEITTFSNTLKQKVYDNGKKDLIASKIWKDEQDTTKRDTFSASCTYNTRTSIRPDAVKFDLYCTYDIYAYTGTPTFDSTTGKMNSFEPQLIGTYDGLASDSALALSKYLGSSYAYSQTISNTGENQSSDTWNVVFEKLPVKINLTGTDNNESSSYTYPDTYATNPNYTYTNKDAIPAELRGTTKTFSYPYESYIPLQLKGEKIQLNGHAVDVKYYIKETILQSDNNNPATYSEATFADNNPYSNTPATKENAIVLKNSKAGNSEAGNSETGNLFKIENDLQKRDITVTKIWEDNGYGDSLHYDINFILTCNDIGYSETKTLNKNAKDEENNPIYSVTFEDLPKYSKNGRILEYTVTEKVTDGSNDTENHKYNYTVSAPVSTLDENNIVTDYTITNTLSLINIPVKKIWNDQSDKFGLRPNNITLQLQRSIDGRDWTDVPINPETLTESTLVLGAQVEPITLTASTPASNEWSIEFKNLLRYAENNKEYQYKVVESGVNGAYYAPVYSAFSTNDAQLTVTNNLITDTVYVKKVWANDDNYTSLRYPVKVTLSNVKITNDPIVNIAVAEADKYIAVQDVPLKDQDGKDIIYELIEDVQKYHYTASQKMETTDGKRYYTLTNTLPLTTITVNKTWDAGYPENANKPGTIAVKLTRKSENGTYQDVATCQLTNFDTFNNLLMYDENNKLYTYKVEETNIPVGYSVTYPNQEEPAVKDTTPTPLTIVNTTKRGEAVFTKYDDSYNEAYHITDDEDKKKTIKDVQFALYLSNDTLVKIKKINGKYQPDEYGTDVIMTDEDGKIYLENLTPNCYYLKETSTPQGYQENTTRKYEFTINADGSPTYTSNSSHIGNQENLSSITLTKKDATSNQVITKSPATYYLLRKIPEGITMQNNTYQVNGEPWEICGTYQTTNGTFTVNNLIFGTYLFWEVKAPVGYEVDNSNPVQITIDAQNAGTTQTQDRTDPRKTAHVKILKTDENGEPLNGAIYELYKQVGDEPNALNDQKIESNITTGYKGMNEAAIVIDGQKWGNYYFKEVTAPVGYTVKDTIVPFTINEETADELLHIVRANNAQKTGNITLTKVAAGAIGNISAGAPLNGAIFNLYKSGANTPIQIAWDATDGVYTVDPSTENMAIETGKNTSKKGKFTITGLSWGEYELKEVTAPDGFKIKTDAIKFTVGRNNTDGQELICENEPKLAKITIMKEITKRVEAWGTPTFVFNIIKKDALNQGMKKSVCIEIETGTTAQQTIELEPGEYQISELAVSRYQLDSLTLKIDDGNEQDIKNKTFTINADDVDKNIILKAINSIQYYDKASYTSAEVNEFNGIKGLEVVYSDQIQVSTIDHSTFSIDKNDDKFKAYKIMSNGDKKQITDLENLTINGTVNNSDVTDSGTQFTFTNEKIYVKDSVYTLQATYQGVSCNFDIHFDQTAINDSKQEKILLLQVDDGNQCYFTINNQQTNTCRLICIITGTDGNQKISKILYNGEVIAEGDAAVIEVKGNEIKVNQFTVAVDASVNNKHFDGWETIPENKAINAMILDLNENTDVLTLKAKIS